MEKQTKRRDYVKAIQELIRQSGYNNLVIKYGFYSYTDNNKNFYESEVDVRSDSTKEEAILVKYVTQSDEYGIIQSIDMDSPFSILKDIVHAIDKL